MTKKARFIEKLVSLSVGEKEKILSFFSKYPCYENRIDWNIKSLQYSDFERVFKAAENSRGYINKEAKIDPKILFKKYNCLNIYQTHDVLIVSPLDWECAVFINSFRCGGEGAQWCIGESDYSERWDEYNEENRFFLIYFIKKHPLYGRKAIVQYNYATDELTLWDKESKIVSTEIIEQSVFMTAILDIIKRNSNSSRFNLLAWYICLCNEETSKGQMFFPFDVFEEFTYDGMLCNYLVNT